MKARRISTTITCGAGSEIHNHDLEYRSTLSHVHGTAADVIEIIPYRPYKEQINKMLKPYIDDYNRKQADRYMDAWARFNDGKIKTKPRKANYKPLGYDYYEDHKEDTYFNRITGKNEQLPMFRSLILGLGDRADRKSGTITEQEAVQIFTNVIDQWPELFPEFKLLGATIHLDEDGFYHMHIDYKPLCEPVKDVVQEQGLRVSVSQEAALEHMGYEPEQSLINGRDKAPLRFNAFRNHLYQLVESELNAQGLRLEYGVTKRKEPFKDSSKNQSLENWQETQDRAQELQERKNHMLDVLDGDYVSPEAYQNAIGAANDIERMLQQVSSQRRSRLNSNNVIVEFSLFDQLKSFVEEIKATIGLIVAKAEGYDKLVGDYNDLVEYSADLEEKNRDLESQLKKSKSLDDRVDHSKWLEVEQENRKLRRLLEKQRQRDRQER